MKRFRNFAVCGLFAVAFCLMLLTQSGSMPLFIAGMVLSLTLTSAADWHLSDWQLHLRDGEQEEFGMFGFRYIIYFAEKLLIAYITLRISESLASVLHTSGTFSLCWLCFAAVMALTACIMFIRGAVRTSRAAA